MYKFQGSIKKEVEFSGVFTKNSCGSSMGLGFGLLRIFAEFPGVKACGSYSSSPRSLEANTHQHKYSGYVTFKHHLSFLSITLLTIFSS